MGYWEDLRGDTDEKDRATAKYMQQLAQQQMNVPNSMPQQGNVPNSMLQQMNGSGNMSASPNVYKKPAFLKSFFEESAVHSTRSWKPGDRTPSFSAGGSWKQGVSPSYRIAQEMGEDMRATNRRRIQKIGAEEEERFEMTHKRITPKRRNVSNSLTEVDESVPPDPNEERAAYLAQLSAPAAPTASNAEKANAPAQKAAAGRTVDPNEERAAFLAQNAAPGKPTTSNHKKGSLSAPKSSAGKPVEAAPKKPLVDRMDRMKIKIRAFLALRGEEANLDDRVYLIMKGLACEDRLPTQDELGGKPATPAEVRTAQKKVEKLPDMIWEEEELPLEDQKGNWEKTFQEIIRQDETLNAKDKFEGDGAFKLYSTNRYFKIMNMLLREGRCPTEEEMPPKPKKPGVRDESGPVTMEELMVAMAAIEMLADEMDNAKHAKLDKNRVVYRGAGNFYTNLLKSTFGVKEEDSEAKMRKKMQGGAITDKGFMSTSLDVQTAKMFAYQGSKTSGTGQKGTGTIVQLYVPKGTKGQFIAPLSEYRDEEELLLNSNTPIRIIDVTKSQDWASEDGVHDYLLVRGSVFAGNLLGAHRGQNAQGGQNGIHQEGLAAERGKIQKFE